MRSIDETTAAARIRDAALARFPVDGFEGTTVRAIAEDAGVSAALVIHHFGSKEGLRQACDEYVIARIGQTKTEAIESKTLTDPSTMQSGLRMAGPLIKYLAWALASGSDQAARVFDDLVAESTRLLELAVEHGAMHPGPDPLARTAVQLAMQMGTFVMHEHLGRVLGVDPMSEEGVARIARATLELFSGAMFPPGRAEEMLAALEAAANRKEEHDG
ncbi:MAG TPA: TetR family transcriptional regulator [Acidimicrobiia bacterium]|nr:TetR family transcriptional regulator [Acidimicrobiia bacterium]